MSPTAGQRASAAPGLYLLVAVLLAALRFWQVQFSHAADADQFLAHVAAIAPFDHVSSWSAFGDIASYYRQAAPGWYPFGPLQLAPWLTGISIAAAKFLQYLLIVASFGLFAFVARKVLGSDAAAILAVVVALCAWQFRTVHDPTIGTSFLTVWSAVTVLGAYAGWLGYRDSRHPLSLASCCLASVLAVLNGPITCGLIAVLAIVALRSQRRPAAFAVCAIAIAGAVASIAAGPPLWPWQHGGALASNALMQLVAPLPTSFRALGGLPVARVADLYYGTHYIDDRFLLIPAITLAGWAFAIVCALAAYISSSARVAEAETASKPEGSGDGLILGCSFWFVPALALGGGGEWQHGLPPGQAFESVYFEYLGFAVIAAIAIRRLNDSRLPFVRLVPSLLALAVFVLAYGNARSDAYVLAWSARIDEPRARLAQAGKAGFFEAVPDGALVAIAPSLPFPGRAGSGISDPKYVLFEYTGKRFVTERLDGASEPNGPVWILDAPREPGILVSLSHWTQNGAAGPLVDRALGFAVDREIWSHAAGVRRGVVRTVSPLRIGRSIDARRLCGPVPRALAFAPSRPALVWGSGFIPTGPYGYVTGPLAPSQSALGVYLTFFPKMYMEDRGTMTIVPSSCPPGTIVLKADIVSSRASRLAVRTPAGTQRFAISGQASTIVVRVPRALRSPFQLYFSTDAPAVDWEPNDFRYERDVPVKRRIVIEPADLWELP